MESETLIDANGVQVCAQAFGRPADPAILLIHGACASMLWWETELCQRLAARGRYVIRYDQRDTGRSTSYPPGEPGYALSDLVADALAVLDAYGIDRAHWVGRSMSGSTVLAAGVDHPERVASLTFVTTTSGDDDLPAGTISWPGPPTSYEGQPAIDYIVAQMAAFAGDSPHFDEPAIRRLAEQDVARTGSMASTLSNPFMIDFDAPKHGGFADLTAPTLVVHGELDPVFPLEHGRALQSALPGARLVVLAGAGHDVPPPTWDLFVDALVEHTAGTHA
jgi:pimeloyl-ACP methyl ester carboxylesterase